MGLERPAGTASFGKRQGLGGKILSMYTFFKSRAWIALLAVLGLAALVILAGGLRDVSFLGGQSLGAQTAHVSDQPVVQFINNLEDLPLWKALLVWAILLLIFVLMSLILSPGLRRQMVMIFLRLSAVGFLLFLLFRYFHDAFMNVQIPEASPLAARASDGDVTVPVFEPPPSSPWLSFAVSLGVLAALAALVWGMVRWWERRRKFLELQRPLQDIAQIARVSLDDLSMGRAWDDVILESYDRMSRAVEKRRGLFRDGAMTPSEFAARLEQAGLPADAVRRLTGLFERTRYGARTSTDKEIQEATQCLTAILRYCGEAT